MVRLNAVLDQSSCHQHKKTTTNIETIHWSRDSGANWGAEAGSKQRICNFTIHPRFAPLGASFQGNNSSAVNGQEQPGTWTISHSIDE